MSNWLLKGKNTSSEGDDNAKDKRSLIGDDTILESGFRRRATEGACFTSSKCPNGSGLLYSCELPFGFVWTPMAIYKNTDSDENDEDNDIESESEDDVMGGKNESALSERVKKMEVIKCYGDLPPVLCLACLLYINPFAEVDFSTGIWNCPLCGQENVVPKREVKNDNSDIMKALNSPFVEYRQLIESDDIDDDEDDYGNEDHDIKKKKQKRSKKKKKASDRKEEDYCTYLLVVDENLSQKDGQAIAPAIEEILKHQPDSFSKTRIGLISFGRSVSMYQLGLSELASAHVYVQPDEDEKENMQFYTENNSYLTEVEPHDNLSSLKTCLSSIFGVTIEGKENEKETTFTSRLAMLAQRKAARLQKDKNDDDPTLSTEIKSPWMKRYERMNFDHPKRCTGYALLCALEMASCTVSKPSRTTRIVFFTNGCPNIGFANVVGPNDLSKKKTKKNEMVPKHDVVDNEMLQEAVDYFDTVASNAVSSGVGIDVFCCGATELTMPVYQAMVEPSGGYVLPLLSFDTSQLVSNLQFVLQSTYVPRSKNFLENLPDDLEFGVECIVDIRTDSFIVPSPLLGSGEVIRDASSNVVGNEVSAYNEGRDLAEGKEINIKNLPSTKAIAMSMMRVQLGRVDPLSTITVLMKLDDSFDEDDEYAFFQLVARYVSPRGDQVITRVYSFQLPVADSVNDFLKCVDDEAMSVVLGKVAVYRAVHGREETSDTRDVTTAGDPETQEALAYEAQVDIDATVQRISGAFRLLVLEEKTKRLSNSSKSKKSKSKLNAESRHGSGSDSSLDFAFPPSVKETLNRLYHFRRGPLISPGPMSSLDNRAERRGLYLRLPVEDCLQMMRPSVISTGSVAGIISSFGDTLSFPAETLILWDDSIVAADFHDTMFIWSGAECTANRFDRIRDKFEETLLEASQNRFPQPKLYFIEDGDSMSRKFTARLAPSHADPIDNQILHFPQLSELKPETLKKLRSKFIFYDSESDESFRTWFWRVASASNSSRLDGLSLCE